MEESRFQDLRIEFAPEQEREFGSCPCCGEMTRRVWGYVYDCESSTAAYFVEWTPGHAREANVDLIIGTWGNDTSAVNRASVAVEYKLLETGPAFRLIDARTRRYADGKLASRALSREEASTDENRDRIFAILDAIYIGDPRLGDLRPA
jgi:hypothetical protein